MSEYRVEIPAAELDNPAGETEYAVFLLGPFYRDAFWALVARARERKIDRFRVTVDFPHKPKSTGPGSQNNHFHGHCRQFALWHGNSVTAIKEWVKREASDRMGYPEEMLPDLTTMPRGVAEASSADVSLLIECVHILAAEEGITLIEQDWEKETA